MLKKRVFQAEKGQLCSDTEALCIKIQFKSSNRTISFLCHPNTMPYFDTRYIKYLYLGIIE